MVRRMHTYHITNIILYTFTHIPVYIGIEKGFSPEIPQLCRIQQRTQSIPRAAAVGRCGYLLSIIRETLPCRGNSVYVYVYMYIRDREYIMH